MSEEQAKYQHLCMLLGDVSVQLKQMEAVRDRLLQQIHTHIMESQSKEPQNEPVKS